MIHSCGPVWTTTRASFVPPADSMNKKGASMHYIIQILAAILVGTAIGAILGPRNKVLFVGSAVAIALGLVAIFTASWVMLAIGTAVFLVVQGMQRAHA